MSATDLEIVHTIQEFHMNTAQMGRAIVDLRTTVAALEARLATMDKALEEIGAYWNGHYNQRALTDACEWVQARARQAREDT